MRIGHFEIEQPDPPLQSPHCIALLRPWVNVGNVGQTVLGRLARLYGAEQIGGLVRPGQFYDFTRYRPEIKFADGKRKVQVPNTAVLAGRATGNITATNDHLLPKIRAHLQTEVREDLGQVYLDYKEEHRIALT